MKDIVNLDPDVVSKARESRDNLLENIAEFDEDGFFDLYEEYNVPSDLLRERLNVVNSMTLI